MNKKKKQPEKEVVKEELKTIPGEYGSPEERKVVIIDGEEHVYPLHDVVLGNSKEGLFPGGIESSIKFEDMIADNTLSVKPKPEHKN